MKTNSANSIAGSTAAAARALAEAVPAARHELADGAMRARGQLSAGVVEAREHLEEGRTRLTDALDAAVAATRSGLRDYRRQAELQRDAAAERAHELRAMVAARPTGLPLCARCLCGRRAAAHDAARDQVAGSGSDSESNVRVPRRGLQQSRTDALQAAGSKRSEASGICQPIAAARGDQRAQFVRAFGRRIALQYGLAAVVAKA